MSVCMYMYVRQDAQYDIMSGSNRVKESDLTDNHSGIKMTEQMW